MTKIEEKRFNYIKSKHDYTDEKVNFLVRTGLTFEPSKLNEEVGGWHYPKGAAFKSSSEESAEPIEPDNNYNTQHTLNSIINNNNNNTTVYQSDNDSGTPLDMNSTVNTFTVEDGDGNPDNNPVLGTSDGEILMFNGQSSND